MTPFDVAPLVLIGAPILGILATVAIEVHRAGRDHEPVDHGEQDAYDDFTARDGQTVTIPRRPDLYLVTGRVIHAEHRFAARRAATDGPEGPWAA